MRSRSYKVLSFPLLVGLLLIVMAYPSLASGTSKNVESGILVFANSTNTTNSITSSTSNSMNITITGSELYNGTCFSCVYNNYTYCPADNTCRPLNYTNCSMALLNSSSGCPIRSQCNLTGFDGFIKLINSTY